MPVNILSALVQTQFKGEGEQDEESDGLILITTIFPSLPGGSGRLTLGCRAGGAVAAVQFVLHRAAGP